MLRKSADHRNNREFSSTSFNSLPFVSTLGVGGGRKPLKGCPFVAFIGKLSICAFHRVEYIEGVLNQI